MAARAQHRASPEEHDPTRERILDTAIDLFARRGVEGVSLSLLGDQVGLHKSTLFYYFRSKQELAQAAFERALQPLGEIVAELGAPDASLELEALVERVLALDDHFAREPASARFLLRALVGPSAELGEVPVLEQPDHPVTHLFAALAAWLERARRAGNVRPLHVRHALVNLLGLSLLYPSIADELGRDVFRSRPDTAAVRRSRRTELATHVRSALAPLA